MSQQPWNGGVLRKGLCEAPVGNAARLHLVSLQASLPRQGAAVWDCRMGPPTLYRVPPHRAFSLRAFSLILTDSWSLLYCHSRPPAFQFSGTSNKGSFKRLPWGQQPRSHISFCRSSNQPDWWDSAPLIERSSALRLDHPGPDPSTSYHIRLKLWEKML